MRPTKRDFDAAVQQPWDDRRCLIAQCIMRQGLDVSNKKAWDAMLDHTTEDGRRNENLMATFDDLFQQPGDEKGPELVALRDSLPE